MNITLQDIQTAHERIAPHIHRTPVLTNKSINAIAGCDIYFKCENFQKIGAFKIRGGMNASLSLSTDKLKNGLATHSSGNHAQAIAVPVHDIAIQVRDNEIVLGTHGRSVYVAKLDEVQKMK